jgi:hypothetical protein
MRSGPRIGFQWRPETIIYAFQLWHRQHARVPFAHEWERAGENHPSRHTVARVFGGWNAGIVQAGFSPRPRGRQPSASHRDATVKYELV